MVSTRRGQRDRGPSAEPYLYAPDALGRLFAGENVGKRLMLRVLESETFVEAEQRGAGRFVDAGEVLLRELVQPFGIGFVGERVFPSGRGTAGIEIDVLG